MAVFAWLPPQYIAVKEIYREDCAGCVAAKRLQGLGGLCEALIGSERPVKCQGYIIIHNTDEAKAEYIAARMGGTSLEGEP